MFEHARRELAWLIEDGYTQTHTELARARFALDYRSDYGAVLIGVHLAISEVQVRIGLPSITWFSGGGIDLLYALTTRGLCTPNPLPPNGASQEQRLAWFQGYLDGLRALRHHELAGDWSRYDGAGRAAMKGRVAERIAEQDRIVQDIVARVDEIANRPNLVPRRDPALDRESAGPTQQEQSRLGSTVDGVRSSRGTSSSRPKQDRSPDALRVSAGEAAMNPPLEIWQDPPIRVSQEAATSYGHCIQTGEKSTFAVGATLPLRPGAAAQVQYTLV